MSFPAVSQGQTVDWTWTWKIKALHMGGSYSLRQELGFNGFQVILVLGLLCMYVY